MTIDIDNLNLTIWKFETELKILNFIVNTLNIFNGFK